MYEAGDLRKGLKIQIEGEPYVITDFEFSKPGKGQAIYRVRMRNMLSGSSVDRSYRSNDKFDSANLLAKPMQYSFFDGHNYSFLDPETYETHLADEHVVGDNKAFLVENTLVDILFFGERIIDMTLPPNVVLKVLKSDPAVRGDTATNVLKPATVETGAEIQVPLFVNEGELIRVDTRTGAYVERVKK